MLTKKTKYALHALTYLAKQHGGPPVQIKEIAGFHKIPQKFLESILLELKKGGFLASRQGVGGGYQLARDPKQITLASLIRMLDGPIAMLPCVSKNYYQPCDDCADEQACGLHKIMIQVRDETLKLLENKTLHDIASLEKTGG
jgi:Rrf2 family protein